MAADLLAEHEAGIQSISLIPSAGGKFEVMVDGQLVYSKLATGRHAEPGEVSREVRKLV